MNVKSVKWSTFLKDIFICSLGSYGGPVLAILTFLVWALPAVAVAFIIYAAITLSRKVLKDIRDWILYAVMLILGLLLVGYSMWVVPGLLILGGFAFMIPKLKERSGEKITYKPRWMILVVVIGLAFLHEGLREWITAPWVTLYTSFYRYGYSVIGGGQIVIPLMIQDLVESQSLLSIKDFLAGYAIDQAIPGPLFSFAAFVSSRSFSGTGFSFAAGLIGGFSIFLPGILLVFFMFPLWRSVRKFSLIRYFLKGVTVTAASLIAMTAITQSVRLPVDIAVYIAAAVSTLLLLTKKVPAPLIVAVAIAAGFIF